MADVQRSLAAGVDRVILGTVAVEQPQLVGGVLAAHGAASVAVALDARDGFVRTRGWQKDSGIAVVELGRQMQALGVTTVIHTDIARDGVLTGVNAEASAALAAATNLAVIASGGLASLADVEHVATFAARGVTGVITGRALYEGKLDLGDALRVAEKIA
jgi:phosphoribosylformimino-5-aminoimidazole carboxamide ribotide isomerase